MSNALGTSDVMNYNFNSEEQRPESCTIILPNDIIQIESIFPFNVLKNVISGEHPSCCRDSVFVSFLPTGCGTETWDSLVRRAVRAGKMKVVNRYVTQILVNGSWQVFKYPVRADLIGNTSNTGSPFDKLNQFVCQCYHDEMAEIAEIAGL